MEELKGRKEAENIRIRSWWLVWYLAVRKRAISDSRAENARVSTLLSPSVSPKKSFSVDKWPRVLRLSRRRQINAA